MATSLEKEEKEKKNNCASHLQFTARSPAYLEKAERLEKVVMNWYQRRLQACHLLNVFSGTPWTGVVAATLGAWLPDVNHQRRASFTSRQPCSHWPFRSRTSRRRWHFHVVRRYGRRLNLHSCFGFSPRHHGITTTLGPPSCLDY